MAVDSIAVSQFLSVRAGGAASYLRINVWFGMVSMTAWHLIFAARFDIVWRVPRWLCRKRVRRQ
jgi:hypothetical protein